MHTGLHSEPKVAGNTRAAGGLPISFLLGLPRKGNAFCISVQPARLSPECLINDCQLLVWNFNSGILSSKK